MSPRPPGEAPLKHVLDVLFFGRANIDLTVRVPAMPQQGRTTFGSSLAITPGGKSLNQAITVTRLGGTSGLVANVGDDEWGRTIVGALADAHVDVIAMSRIADTQTGSAIINVTPDGESYVVLALSPKTDLTPANVHNALSTMDARILVVQLDQDPDTVAAVLSTRGTRPAIGNLVPRQGITRHHLAQLDALVVNQHEAAAILGVDRVDPLMAAQQLREHGPRAVVVTAGGNGASYSTDSIAETVPAEQVQVIDTTGAGDAFLACLALHLSRRAPLSTAIEKAVATGTAAVQHQGPHERANRLSPHHDI